ncbi:DUF551 domain-containing protein [Serratia marcescens]|uniref:DUF551 domain-containing protein n=1 Tax=Serratia marcescens TaxID=615 RepID=UPI00249F4BB6|nr:DUF551 domain-containing protein [Serratia marcescens]MDI3445967.1 DUF551 domain-containing protein [Serratia marcescens]
MTLTIERLKWLHDAATELSATKLKMTMRPDELLVLTRELLANREAQSVITDEAIDRIVVPLSPDGLDEEKHHCEWHLYHDRERIRKELREYFTAPPAPALEEFGDRRRCKDKKCNAPIVGYSVDGLCEDCYMEMSKRPALAVPDCFLELLKHAGSMAMGNDWNNGTAAKHHRTKLCEAVEACRAAMLAQPVTGCWIACSERLPEIGERDWRTALPVLVKCEIGVIPAYYGFTYHEGEQHFGFMESVKFGDASGSSPEQYENRLMMHVTHWMPLPVAPEGGNDHDTRR